MSGLSDRLPETRTDGQPAVNDQAAKLINAVEEAIAEATPTRYRDDSPVPVVGTAPPVAQPGRPPMSQGATDASALMLSGSVLTAVVGGSATAILWVSGQADPVVVGIVFGAPAALVLAISRLVRRAKDVLPDEHHHHYTGPVHNHNQHVHSQSRLWGKSTTNL